MKQTLRLLAYSLLLILFSFAPAHADQLWIGGVLIETDDVILDEYPGPDQDTRNVTSDSRALGHLYMSDRKNAITGASSGGSGLTHAVGDPTDLQLVTAGHNVVKSDKVTLHKHFRVTFPSTGETIYFRDTDLVYLGDVANGEDIAIFNLPDDIQATPMPMLLDFKGQNVRVLASTHAFHTKLGTSFRVPTLSGECSFWREPEVISRRADLVATDCVSTLGSSGSPLIGTTDSGVTGIVAVFSAVHKRIYESLPGTEGSLKMGTMEQRRTMFKLASFEP